MLRQVFPCSLVQFRPNRLDSRFLLHRSRHSLHTGVHPIPIRRGSFRPYNRSCHSLYAKLSFRPQGGTCFFFHAASSCSLTLERPNRPSLVPNPRSAKLLPLLIPQTQPQRHPIFQIQLIFTFTK